MRVLAFSGYDQHGKSTMAREAIFHLIEAGLRPVLIPMAAPLKRMLVEQLGIPRYAVYDKPTTDEARKLMEGLGHGMRSWKGEDFWLDQWRETAARIEEESAAQVAIVDDVRYLNEASYFQGRGALLYVNDIRKPNNGQRDHPYISQMADRLLHTETPEIALRDLHTFLTTFVNTLD